MLTSNHITNYKNQVEGVKSLLNDGLIKEAKLKLDEFKIHNEMYYSLYSNYLYLKGDYASGIKLLEEAMEKIPFSFEITYNLATLKSVIGEFFESLKLFAICARIAVSEENKKEIAHQLNVLINDLKQNPKVPIQELLDHLKLAEEIMKEGDERIYPLNRFNESLVKRTVENREGELYFTEMYKAMHITNVNNESRYFFKNEIMPGVIADSYSFRVTNRTTLPVALFKDYDEIKVEGPNGKLSFPKDTLANNQYNYYTFTDPGSYKIYSEKPFFIGNPIDLKPEKKVRKLSCRFLLMDLQIQQLKRTYRS